MGNRKNKLSWTWPLISYRWLPEILGSFGNLIEPTWEGLNRQVSLHAANHAFSNRIFNQLKQLLMQTSLIEVNGRYIRPIIEPTEAKIKNHLTKMLGTKAPYSKFYKWISDNNIELYFEKIKASPPQIWSEISNYSVFKQWCELYQYIGYGFLIDKYHFMPNSTITTELSNDIAFVEMTIKATGDPRHLTGRDSLHSEGDFLSWSKGEDNLSITTDNEISPRIPLETIIEKWKTVTGTCNSWNKAINVGTEQWERMINQSLKGQLPFHFPNMIYTWKTLLDYFIFRRPNLTDDFIEEEHIYHLQNKWDTIKHFRLSVAFWRTLKNLYKDVTRLYWGVSYYRNSLKRPLQQFEFDERIFEINIDSIQHIHIRCFRSKRTIQGIIRTFSYVFQSLKRLHEKHVHLHYKNKCQEISKNLNEYLPINPIERSEIIDQLESIIPLDKESKKILIHFKKHKTDSDCPNIPSLQVCFWVNQYHELLELPETSILESLKRNLIQMEEGYLKEIEYFERDLTKWDEAYLSLMREMTY